MKLLTILPLAMVLSLSMANVFAANNMNMDKNMQNMEMTMDKAEKTKSTKQRKELLNSHMTMMMNQMQGMMGHGMSMGTPNEMQAMKKVINQIVRQQKMMMEFMEYND